MTVTREQVADLQPGDVVRITGWHGLTVEGPVSTDGGGRDFWMGQYIRLSHPVGDMPNWMLRGDATLTVVSRAPRPLYANHRRTEPAPADVVREDGADRACTWVYEDPDDEAEPWRHILGQKCHTHRVRWTRPSQMPARLRLLVDGETGQVVP